MWLSAAASCVLCVVVIGDGAACVSLLSISAAEGALHVSVEAVTVRHGCEDACMLISLSAP
jgi:hypothetical protein